MDLNNNNGVLQLVDKLTKNEFKLVLGMYDKQTINRYNVLTKPFKYFTPDMADSTRSRFKRKLIEEGIIGVYGKHIMLNPYIFISKGDKNIRNCVYLTQQVWKYMFMDVDAGNDAVNVHAEHIFGTMPLQSEFMLVGNGDYTKLVRKPQIDQC